MTLSRRPNPVFKGSQIGETRIFRIFRLVFVIFSITNVLYLLALVQSMMALNWQWPEWGLLLSGFLCIIIANLIPSKELLHESEKGASTMVILSVIGPPPMLMAICVHYYEPNYLRPSTLGPSCFLLSACYVSFLPAYILFRLIARKRAYNHWVSTFDHDWRPDTTSWWWDPISVKDMLKDLLRCG